MKLVVMIPAYNEEKSIAGVIREIPLQCEGVNSVEILLIDDGSTDSTVEQATKAGISKVIFHKEKQGYGRTFRDGLDAAIEMGADITVNIDADGQYNAGEISKLISPIVQNKADMVLGWRDIKNLDFMPTGKKFGNRVATRVTRWLSGLPIVDAQTGFRAYSREAVMRLNLSGGYTHTQESIIQASYKNIKIEQIPAEFRPRDGKSRLVAGLLSYATKAGATIIGVYRDYKISKLALLAGSLLLIIGLVLAILIAVLLSSSEVITSYIYSAILALGLIILGIQLILFSLSSEMNKSLRLLNEQILYLLKKERSERR
jgi:glycosyltransferase involved in cell wall biosynthesis